MLTLAACAATTVQPSTSSTFVGFRKQHHSLYPDNILGCNNIHFVNDLCYIKQFLKDQIVEDCNIKGWAAAELPLSLSRT